MNLEKKIVLNKLLTHTNFLKNIHLRDLFIENTSRFEQFSFQLDEHLFDFSKNFITDETLALFSDLAKCLELNTKIDHLFQGKAFSNGKDVTGLHTALRAQDNTIMVNNRNIMPDIKHELDHMKSFTAQIIDGHWRGCSDQIITDVVNIGIGGSHLGPLLLTETLTSFRTRLNIHFVSNCDGIHTHQLTRHLNPETTLFLIVSKTFSTQETLINAEHLINWFIQSTGKSPFERHVIGISANASAMQEYGIHKDNQFLFWDFVGGRFSIWSSVGLASALAVGFENFNQFLQGGHLVDKHFRNTDFKHNIPFLLAFLDFLYIQYWQTQTRAILPYHSYLKQFPAYLQQLSMESLGKSVSFSCKEIDYPTGNVIWGELGSNGQHAFYQLLHQGKLFIPVDLLVPMHLEQQQEEHTQFMLANALAQTQALMQGKPQNEIYDELRKKNFSAEEIKQLLPHRSHPGNRPSTTILLANLTPKTLGEILAIYEHKIFVQSIIWNINPFDQWGVEFGKELATKYLGHFKSQSASHPDELMRYIHNFLKKAKKQ